MSIWKNSIRIVNSSHPNWPNSPPKICIFQVFLFPLVISFAKAQVVCKVYVCENFFYPPPPPPQKKNMDSFFCQKTLFFTTKNFWSWKIGFFDKKSVDFLDYLWVFFFFFFWGDKKQFSCDCLKFTVLVKFMPSLIELFWRLPGKYRPSPLYDDKCIDFSFFRKFVDNVIFS